MWLTCCCFVAMRVYGCCCCHARFWRFFTVLMLNVHKCTSHWGISRCSSLHVWARCWTWEHPLHCQLGFEGLIPDVLDELRRLQRYITTSLIFVVSSFSWFQCSVNFDLRRNSTLRHSNVIVVKLCIHHSEAAIEYDWGVLEHFVGHGVGKVFHSAPPISHSSKFSNPLSLPLYSMQDSIPGELHNF